MPPRPLVSIVIPTCNRREVLSRCLEALAIQTFRDFEIIVVDDCSSDDTPQFLEDFAAEHEDLCFRSSRNEQNHGANASRNIAVRAAQGEYVALLDDDCIARQDWLEKLIGGFTSERVAAVTGMVEDAPPANIYDLTYKGTHRVRGNGATGRLVAGNMCVRRKLLLEYHLDEVPATGTRAKQENPDITVSGLGGEEGLFLTLRAAGYEQRVVSDSVVSHEQHFTRRSFFRQALRGGRSAARLVYKYYLPPRLDMLPFILAYGSLPLALFDLRLIGAPSFFFAGALAAITYNDLYRKEKTIGETMRSFPMLVIYYHIRLTGYVWETLRLRLTRRGLRRVRLSSKLHGTSE